MIKLIDQKTIELVDGRLAAHCPTSESTITVVRNNQSVTDLGTAFGLNTLQGEALEVMVFSGRVLANAGQLEKPYSANQGVKLNKESSFTDIPYNIDPYKEVLSALVKNDLKTSGAVKAVNPWSINDRSLATEAALITLESSDIQGRVELRSEEFAEEEKNSEKNSYRLLLEDPAKSYLLRAFPTEDKNAQRKGSVTFPEPILGIITQQKKLNAFERVYDILSTPPTLKNMRGLERIGGKIDEYTISEDRKTLHFNFYPDVSIDDIRIITEK